MCVCVGSSFFVFLFKNLLIYFTFHYSKSSTARYSTRFHVTFQVRLPIRKAPAPSVHFREPALRLASFQNQRAAEYVQPLEIAINIPVLCNSQLLVMLLFTLKWHQLGGKAGCHNNQVIKT